MDISYEVLKNLYQKYIYESLYFPDQFGNPIPLIIFHILLIICLLFYRKKIRNVKILFAVFATTFLFKSFIYYTPFSSCARVDSDGYTEIAKSMFNKKHELNPKLTYSKEESNQSLINFDGRIFFLKDHKIYEINEDNNYKVINSNLNIKKIFAVNKKFYFTDNKNNLFLYLNVDFKKYNKIYFSNSEITYLQIFNDETFISNINGKIININSNKIIYDYQIPIKYFYLQKDLLFIYDFYNKIKIFNTKTNILLNEIILSTEPLNYENSLDIEILKSKNTSLSLVQDIFLEFSKKNYEIKYIKKYKDYFIFFFYNGRIAKLNSLLEAKEIITIAKNRFDVDKKLIFYDLFFYVQNVVFLNDKFITNNFDGDLLFFNLEKEEKFIKTNKEKQANLYEFSNIKIFKDALRLPAYPLISGSLMKITDKYDSCNIVAFQNLFLFLLLLLLLFIKGIKPIYIIILTILLADPYNYLISYTSMDYPHFFEIIIFSLFIFLNIYYEKKYFINFVLLILIILSSLISTKILVAMIIFHLSEFIYFTLLKNFINFKKISYCLIYIILILASYLTINNYFPGQHIFNQKNINQKFITYLMINNSNSFEINEVNNFKSLLKLPIESKITYGGNGLHRSYSFSILSDHLAGFTNKYPKPIINTNTGKPIKEISPNILHIILENKIFFVKDIINNIFTSLPVLFTISNFQEKNKFILFISFFIFCVGLSKSYKLYKNFSIILFLSLIFLYLFYCFFLTPFSRFMVIYSVYLHSIYILGILFISKYINKKLFKKNTL